MNERNERLDCAEIVKVIRATLAKGAGSPDDPVRQVIRYYDTDGTFIGEVDDYQRGALGTLSASSAVR